MSDRNRDRAPARNKAGRYLLEGRVVIDHAAPGYISATVRGDGALHQVTHRDQTWTCTSPAPTGARCSHLHAVALVTAPCRATDTPTGAQKNPAPSLRDPRITRVPRANAASPTCGAA